MAVTTTSCAVPARGDEPVADFAHRAASAGTRRDQLRDAARILVRIRDRDTDAGGGEQRGIRRVVADADALFGGEPELREQLVEHGKLVAHPLKHVADAELA